MSCHAKGMINKTDQIREAVLKAGDSYTKEEVATIERLYPEKKHFDKLLHDAAEDFRKAVEATGSKLSATEPIVALSSRFEGEVDLKLAAAEMGVTPEEFLKGLRKAPTSLGRSFSPLQVGGGTVQRDVLVKGFGELVRVMNLGQFQAGEGSSGERQPGKEIEVEIASGVKMKFCWVPPGKAMLGSPAGEKDRITDETEHEYETKGFWMAKYPVTQEEWAALMGENPSFFVPSQKDVKKAGITDTKRFPVEEVSWDDCQEFINKFKEKGIAAMGKGKFCLPHENEWELAARGGKGNKQPFYFGDELNGKQANCNGEYPYGTVTKGPYLSSGQQKWAVTRKAAPHPWGLCDMSGNVWQWCDNYYDSEQKFRALRGGCWHDYPRFARAAFRGWLGPGPRGRFGFRVCFRLD